MMSRAVVTLIVFISFNFAHAEGEPGKFGTPEARGSGCPNGVTSSLSPEASAISIIFDQFLVSAGGTGNAKHNRARCLVKVPLTVPKGSQAQLVQIDYRGFNALPERTASRLKVHLGFDMAWHHWNIPLSRVHRTKTFRGPLSEDFELTSSLRKPEWTPCGKSVTLILDSRLDVVSASGAEALAGIDSIDATTAPVKMKLKWRRCH